MLDIFESIWRTDIILEGRKDDLKKQFVDTDKVPEKTFNYFVENDPSGKQKYLQWMLKQSTLASDRYVHIKDVVALFDKAVKQNKIKGQESDITQYDLEQAEELAQGKEKEVTKTQKKKEEKGEVIKIKETDEYLIVVPESHKAACFYGASTKWCISGRISDYWKEFRDIGEKIYIVFDKKENKKYAVAVSLKGKKTIFDEQNKKISMGVLKKSIGEQEEDFEDIFQPASEEERSKWIMEYIKEEATQDANGFWNSDGDVDLGSKRLVNLPVKFGVVGGGFSCAHNKLISLEGAPQEVGRDFYCNNNKLTSLEGAPQEVGDKMHVGKNRKSVEELKKTVDRPYDIVE